MRWWLAPVPAQPVLLLQDSQCGTVIDVSIDCAVKLIGTNCIIYPVNSKDLQHIWVSSAVLLPPPPGSLLGPECCPFPGSRPGRASALQSPPAA